MPSILIVDDEPSQLLLLRVNLEKHGYEVVEADSTAEAKKAILEQDYDLAILDSRLGRVDDAGVELAEMSKQLKPNIPVIIVTAYLEDPELRQAARKTSQAFIIKPYNMNQLLNTVERLLKETTAAMRQKPPGAD